MSAGRLKRTKPTAKTLLSLMLGAKFRTIRMSQGVSAEALAAQLNVCLNTIRWHEAGHTMMRLDKVVFAAHVMGVPITSIAGLKDASAMQDHQRRYGRRARGKANGSTGGR